MEKRILGKTGEEVSILGFGCMRLPVLDPARPAGIDVPLATAMLRNAVDRGVNYIDTAYPYHRNGGVTEPGTSEPFVARALRDGYRAKVKIATKLPTWFMQSRAQMNGILDEQLKRLDVPQIDFYLAHNLNRGSWPRMKEIGLVDFLEEAQNDGRIKHIGFSFHDSYALFEEIVNYYDWSFCQIQYNYLDTEHQAGSRGLELAAGKNMGVVVMEPLRGGYLVNHLPADAKAKLAALRPEWSLADWALRWVWSRPGVGTALSGMSAMPQVEENLAIAARAVPLTGEEEEALEQVRERIVSQTKVGCTACGYCLPCPSGVEIPKVFELFNQYHRFADAASRMQVGFGYLFQIPEKARADKCVHCGACEPKCPQGIHISEEMGEAAEAFRPA